MAKLPLRRWSFRVGAFEEPVIARFEEWSMLCFLVDLEVGLGFCLD